MSLLALNEGDCGELPVASVAFSAMVLIVIIQYIGNQAKHQLVKNSQNTITSFRNLLGKK
jgi:molecular chaperone DnaK (HSP70)